MAKEKEAKSTSAHDDFLALLNKNDLKVPQKGETVKGIVISASKSEVKLDINGVLIGVVRGPELYEEIAEYADLESGDEVEATVIEEENENGEMELSFRYAGHAKAWDNLRKAFKDKETAKVKVIAANKGGLLVNFGQISGFLPVSQLAPDNYPRVTGGDKGKILEQLKNFIGQELEVKVVNLDENEKEDKIIFSEKDVWSEQQKDTILKYKVGTEVDGKITAVIDFGVFINFGDNLEGLIHISELAWQRIENPANLYNVGDSIKAKVISIDGSKIFLSSKKLLKDPWEDVEKKYKKGQIVKGTLLKVNPFGLFVKLDEDIHGLAHISQIGLAPNQKINEAYKVGDLLDFMVVSIEPKDHRLGLAIKKDDLASPLQKKSDQPEPASKPDKKPDSVKQPAKKDEKEPLNKKILQPDKAEVKKTKTYPAAPASATKQAGKSKKAESLKVKKKKTDSTKKK